MTTKLALASAIILCTSGICNANGLYVRQAVGVTTPTTDLLQAGGPNSSTELPGVPTITPTTPAVATTPTAAAPAVDEQTTEPLPGGGGAVVTTRTTTSRTTAPQQVGGGAQPSTTPAHSTSSTRAGAGVAKPSSSTTHAAAEEPATTSSVTQANNIVGAQGGGGGEVAAPDATPAPANVITATKGTGGILEYGECISFESQCNGLCSYGIYSMNCIDGGICLCFKDDPDNTDTGTEEADAD
ncbi:hypothetical protein LPJ56_003486, partial [Coemansia sp. RSA 2599]